MAEHSLARRFAARLPDLPPRDPPRRPPRFERQLEARPARVLYHPEGFFERRKQLGPGGRVYQALPLGGGVWRLVEEPSGRVLTTSLQGESQLPGRLLARWVRGEDGQWSAQSLFQR